MQSAKASDHGSSTASDHAAASTEPEKTKWRALFSFTTAQDVPLLVAAVSCSLAASVASPAQAFIIGKVFDLLAEISAGALTGDDFLQQQSRWILYLVIVACASWLLHALEYIFWITFGERQARRARLQLFQTLSDKDIAWFDTSENGSTSAIARSLTQIQELQLALSQPFGTLVSLSMTAVLGVAQAFYNSWDLTLVTLAGTPLVAFVVIYFGAGTQRSIDDQTSALTKARAVTMAALSAMETVKCFLAERQELCRFQSCISEAAKHYHRIVNKNAIQMACLTFLVQAMFVQAFYYGGILVHRGSRNASQVVTTFFSAITAFQSVQGIVPQLLVLEKGRAAAGSLSSTALQQPRGSANQNIARLRPLKCHGDICLHSVSFRYPGSAQHALERVDMTIHGGRMTFIVGQSGSGKSTIGQLLVRLYTHYDGTITLDGENLQSLETRWLRSKVLLVEQTSSLFNGSIRDNVALGQLNGIEAAQSDVDIAVGFALLQTLISDLPDGIDTVLGADGSTISGGQRQRIALARARLRDPAVLILDESTSALDQISRSLIMDAIRKWRDGKTTIVITHDLAQVHSDDYAFVLQDGTLVQYGWRKELEQLEASPFSRLLADIPDAASSSESVVTPLSSESDTDGMWSPQISPMAFAPLVGFPGGSGMAALPARMTMQRTSTWRLYHLPFPVANQSTRNMTLRRRSSAQSRAMADFMTKNGVLAVQKRQRRRMLDQIQQRPAQKTLNDADQNDAIKNDKQPSILHVLKAFWQDSRTGVRVVLVLGFGCASIHAVCSPIFAFVLAKLLSLYSTAADTSHQALQCSLAILGLAVADATNTYGYRYLLERASQVWVDDLRSRCMEGLLHQPMSFFERVGTTATTLAQILDRDAEEMRNLMGRFIGMVFIAVIMLLTSMVWALAVQWKMTLIALSVSPYILLVTNVYSVMSEKWEGLSNTAVTQSNTILLETFASIKTVRVYTVESIFKKRYDHAVEHTYRTGKKRATITGCLYGMSSSAPTYATAMVFYVGSRLVYGGADVSAILQVFTILIFTISNISAILEYIPQLGSAKDTAGRVLGLAGLPIASHESCGATQISTIGDVDFNHLHFAYPTRPDTTVLTDINLKLNCGTTIAIVGGSGSGKSTIAKLILRLYQAETSRRSDSSASSMVMVNGRSIEHLETHSLRSSIAVVPQNSPIFSASVRDNITYGLEKDSMFNTAEKVIAAAKLAGIDSMINSMPQGYATMLGPGGRGLSGGQAQRVSIARALVRRPSLLILDEATSALDPESAMLIREAILELMQSHDQAMTILIITHSREMMELAEHVVVLDQGMLVEQGTFSDLLASNGHLTNLLHSGVRDQ